MNYGILSLGQIFEKLAGSSSRFDSSPISVTVSYFAKDAAFPDGSTPPSEVRDEWFNLLKDRFKQAPNTCIAIHCVAGLGRFVVDFVTYPRVKARVAIVRRRTSDLYAAYDWICID